MTSSNWQPILHGELAERALASVRAIAQSLAAKPPHDIRPGDLALFWAYVAGQFDDEFVQQAYEASTEALIEDVERGVQSTSLYGGLLSPWVLGHVSSRDTEGLETLLGMFDQLLRNTLKVETWEGDYDLIIGLVGHGVYLLDRLAVLAHEPDGPSSENYATILEALALIVGHFERNAEWTEQGATWFTAPALLPPHQREYAPNGYYNMGLAHGVPGVVGFLGRLAATPAWTPVAAKLLDGAMQWVIAQKVAHPASFFPSQIVPGAPAGGSRTAWCYGDPGVLCALWIAAKHTGKPTDEIEAMALTCAARDVKLCGVADSALCHGSIGLAHIYNRFFQASGNPAFREAAIRWFEHGLAQRDVHGVGTGIGGYMQWMPAPDNSVAWGAAPGFLDGAVGLALGLLAAVGDEPPGWDTLLVCDIPVG